MSYFSAFAQKIAQHVITCHNPECPQNNSMAVLMSPTLFVKLVQSRIADFNNPESRSLVELWGTKPLEKVEIDPRYLMFRAQWDAIIISSWIVRECMADPFAHLRDQID